MKAINHKAVIKVCETLKRTGMIADAIADSACHREFRYLLFLGKRVWEDFLEVEKIEIIGDDGFVPSALWKSSAGWKLRLNRYENVHLSQTEMEKEIHSLYRRTQPWG